MNVNLSLALLRIESTAEGQTLGVLSAEKLLAALLHSARETLELWRGRPSHLYDEEKQSFDARCAIFRQRLNGAMHIAIPSACSAPCWTQNA